MPQLTITSKGQLTLKKEALQHLGAKPGDKIDYELLPNGSISLEAKSRRGRPISELFGILKYDGPPKTLDEIKDAIEAGWAGER
jgi:bifunctional DNA-binding transcriptional regulator/antitoxin component of YhaV-PrlF toxin-antitoxin module